MNRLLFILIDVIAVSIIVIPIMFIINKLCFHNLKKTMMYIVFMLYLSAIFSATGLPQFNDLTFNFMIQPIPFSQITNDIENSLLNIILFIPLGLILPFIFKGYTLKKTISFGLLFSLSIEFLQIFTYRLTDINDLITNTLGALIGYLIFKVCHIRSENHSSQDLYLLIIISFLVWFFIRPLFSSWLWNI